jgi:uncharacterized membrane protein YdjX (TVP38/TMEM64 family)
MKRRLLLFTVFVIILAILYVVFREYVALERVVAYELRLRSLVERYPLRAFAGGLALYVVLSLIPGTTGKSLIYGWLYGFWSALLQVNVALTLAAIITFLFSRYVFRDAIQSRFGFYLDRTNRRLSREGAYLVATLRLLHAPYTLVNYLMGASSIPTKTFWWSTQLGLLPGNVVFVLAGTQLPTLAELTTQGVHSVLTPRLVLAFVLMALFPFLIRWVIHRFRPPGADAAELPGC